MTPCRLSELDRLEILVDRSAAMVLTYWWIECHSAVSGVTDLPQFKDGSSWNVHHLCIGYLGAYGLVVSINVKFSSSSIRWYSTI